MGIIHELSPHVADLIAAGEVVERPASVVKELVENSIDAGATHVSVEIENGGITYIRVTDNGSGMAEEDVKIAFLRHATSKIHDENDLIGIQTLGFRGEALAAICAVSRIDVLTKLKGSLSGKHLKIDGGEIIDFSDAGCGEGTTMVIRDLFYNTPARMKFLKKDAAEAAQVESNLERLALSHPEVSVRMIKDGKEIFHTPGDNQLKSAIYAVYGGEFAKGIVAIDSEYEGIHVSGYVTKPECSRGNRALQTFFVNRRCVKSRIMQTALEEAYKNKIMTGKYPSCVLNIALNLSAVDVNVHPTKLEVKFSNERQIFSAVYMAVKSGLDGDIKRPQFHLKEEPESAAEQPQPKSTVAAPAPPPVSPIKTSVVSYGSAASSFDDAPLTFSDFTSGSGGIKIVAPGMRKPILIEKDEEPPENEAERPIENPVAAQTAPPESVLPETPPAGDKIDHPEPYRIIGEALCSYILVEQRDDILLVDKHAAHERIIYNSLKNREPGDTMPQMLLQPEVVTVSREEFVLLQEHLDEISRLGFEIEAFGNNSFLVRSVPGYLEKQDVTVLLGEISQKIRENRMVTLEVFDELLHMVACKAAVKAGSRTGSLENEELIAKVLTFSDVKYCPHGRPVAMCLTRSQIEKQFKRKL